MQGAGSFALGVTVGMPCCWQIGTASSERSREAHGGYAVCWGVGLFCVSAARNVPGARWLRGYVLRARHHGDPVQDYATEVSIAGLYRGLGYEQRGRVASLRTSAEADIRQSAASGDQAVLPFPHLVDVGASRCRPSRTAVSERSQELVARSMIPSVVVMVDGT